MKGKRAVREKPHWRRREGIRVERTAMKTEIKLRAN